MIVLAISWDSSSLSGYHRCCLLSFLKYIFKINNFTCFLAWLTSDVSGTLYLYEKKIIIKSPYHSILHSLKQWKKISPHMQSLQSFLQYTLYKSTDLLKTLRLQSDWVVVLFFTASGFPDNIFMQCPLLSNISLCADSASVGKMCYGEVI